MRIPDQLSLRTALRHVDLLGKRIADLFELSKLDAGRIAPKTEVFCLAELLQDVVQNHQLEAQRRGVQLTLSANSHAQAPVKADIAMIERVLQNLVDNALRYTAPGGDVTLALCPRGSFIEITVSSDNGRGIAQEHLPHIFERYWRASPVDETDPPGSSSGLGLTIGQAHPDLHGSVVQVKSELQRGTRFEFLAAFRLTAAVRGAALVRAAQPLHACADHCTACKTSLPGPFLTKATTAQESGVVPAGRL
ncbi:MAG: HAMP domain-containing sensor histidine kinase [Rhodococcus sp. (in: high G+C Gram-positive bacteria)]|uniref:sensor histidine kinase n=1 Tax=Rhodococcus sp. TaxID=1831 RepID=UPI002AD9E353|nr:HAMP domain-containing sensor histidine kinase [Rhodococcus sp. (in: high G+C Gram-positive bacteria)]